MKNNITVLCTENLQAFEEGHRSILMGMYSFTPAPIAKALMNVQKHGVVVEVMLGKSNRTDQYSAADFLADSSIPTRIDAQYGIATIKSSSTGLVIGSSWNDTKAAQDENTENIETTTGRALAGRYTASW